MFHFHCLVPEEIHQATGMRIGRKEIRKRTNSNSCTKVTTIKISVEVATPQVLAPDRDS